LNKREKSLPTGFDDQEKKGFNGFMTPEVKATPLEDVTKGAGGQRLLLAPEAMKAMMAGFHSQMSASYLQHDS